MDINQQMEEYFKRENILVIKTLKLKYFPNLGITSDIEGNKIDILGIYGNYIEVIPYDERNYSTDSDKFSMYNWRGLLWGYSLDKMKWYKWTTE